MPLCEWSDEFAIGNEEIDEQHKELFSLLNRLYEDSCDRNSSVDIYEILEKLIDYAIFHFETEQTYMSSIGYRDLDKQIAEHLFFTNKIVQLLQDRSRETEQLGKETVAFLMRWLQHHVTQEDRKLSLCRQM